MYSTCLFCHSSLGRNEVIEHFPVGRRLAFDAARGRLWVVCRSCDRWNLTPLEERWEALEECERQFRDTRLRVSTEHVGLARLREGLTLVRIGAPQRPEMAAWRYGDQFGRRRKRYFMLSGTVAAAAVGVIIAGPIMGVIGGGAVNILNLGNVVRAFRPRVRLALDSTTYALNGEALAHTRLLPHDERGFAIDMPYMLPWNTKLSLLRVGGPQAVRRARPSVMLYADDALHAARILLPQINASGGNTSVVRDAVNLLETTPQAHDVFTNVASGSRADRRIWWSNGAFRLPGRDGMNTIASLPAATRLALEMILHESDERRALEGELAALEERWKEAEEIAAISDDLFVPSNVIARLRGLRES
jgi:hypothetical protein